MYGFLPRLRSLAWLPAAALGTSHSAVKTDLGSNLAVANDDCGSYDSGVDLAVACQTTACVEAEGAPKTDLVHTTPPRSNWDPVYMAICHVLSTRSQDPSTRHGAVLVAADKTVISVGINGTVRGVTIEEALLHSRKPGGKYDYMLHAEDNAICHVDATARLKGATLYITGRPCSPCAMRAMQHGVVRIVFGSRKSHCTHASPGEGVSWAAVVNVATQKGVAIEDYSESGEAFSVCFDTKGGAVAECAAYAGEVRE